MGLNYSASIAYHIPIIYISMKSSVITELWLLRDNVISKKDGMCWSVLMNKKYATIDSTRFKKNALNTENVAIGSTNLIASRSNFIVTYWAVMRTIH